MSENTVRVVVDPSEAKRGAAQSEQALRRLSNTIGDVDNRLRGLDRSIAGVGKASTTADRAFVRTGASARQMAAGLAAANDNAVKANGSLLAMAKSAGRAAIAVTGLALLAGGISGLAVAFTNAADAMSNMEAKLRIAVGSQAALAGAMKEVRSIADSTRSGLTEIGTLYAKMATNSKTLGISQAQVGTATKSFAMILKVGGATAQEAASSILQLGQAMGSGVLNGDEFKSLAENSSFFLDVLSKSMGVARGELKKLGSEGKITGKEIAKALTDPAIIKEVEAKFGMIPVTFADFRTAFANAGMGWAAAIMAGFGVNDSFAVILARFQKFALDIEPVLTNFAAKVKEAFAVVQPALAAVAGVVGPILGALVNNLDLVARAAMVAGAGFLTFKAATAATSIASTVGQVIALEKAMGATSVISAVFSASMKFAQGAVNGLTASLLLNPFVAVAVAVAAVGVALYQFSDRIQIGTKGLGTLADMGHVVWGDIKAGLAGVSQFFSDVWGSITSMATGAWNWIKGIFSPLAQFFETVTSPIVGIFEFMYGGIGFSFMGLLKLIARGMDVWINLFINGAKIIGNAFKNIPAIVGSAVTGAANWVIGGIESMINRAISGINQLISLANNIPMVDLPTLGNVSIGRISGPANPGLGSLTEGVGYNRYVEGYVDSVGTRSDARAARRGAGGASTNAANNPSQDTGTPTPAGAGGGTGKKDTSSKGEDALKKYDEFLQKMRDEIKMAGMLKHEAEVYNAQLEAKNILGEKYTEVQAAEVASLMQQKRLQESLGTIKQSIFEAENQSKINQMKRLGLTEEEAAVEEQLAKYRLDALNKGLTIADITSETWKLEEDRLRTILLQNAAFDAQNAKVEALQKKGKDLIADYSRAVDPRAAARQDFEDRNSAIRAAAGSRPSDVSPEEWTRRVNQALERSGAELEKDLKEVSQKFRDELMSGINEVSGALTDLLGDKLGGAISSLISVFDAIASGTNARQTPIQRLFGGFEDLTGTIGDKLGDVGKLFGKGGEFFKGLSSALGSLGAGATIGAGVAGVGKQLWGKFSNTGSQLGGAAGMLIGGPIGSVIGSVLGGVVGGLVKKSKRGSQSFKFDDEGQLVAGTLRGNSNKFKQAAAGAGNSVISQLNGIAQALGADFQAINMASIGVRDGKWRVDPTGNGVTKVKNGAIDFGKNGEAEAIAYVIQDALKKGILTGMSAFSDRIIRGATTGNLDAQVKLAARYESILRELTMIDDPLMGPVKLLNEEFDKLRQQMIKAGATTAELANVDRYYQEQRKKLLDDSLSQLLDFQDKLNGPGSGVTSVNRLNKMLQELTSFENDIAAGKSIDQSKFTELGSNIFDLARDLYGTATSEFQSIRSRLSAANGGAITNVEEAINTQQPVVDAIVNNNQYLIQGNELLATNNDYLRQIAESLALNQGGGGVVGGFNYGGRNVENL
jgi:tape measure domain-containing protein